MGTDWAKLREELEALPQNPAGRRPLHDWWGRVKRVMDFAMHVRFESAQLMSRLNPYPKPWRRVRFRTEDGVQIAGWLGPQHRTSPSAWGVVVVPGMFATKDDTIHKRHAILIHRHWRVPTLCIDMRAFGESTGIATAGWKEALDVHGAARFLVQEAGVQRVVVLAESMGGAAALNALAHDSQTRTDLIAGMVCFSAFVDAKDAVEYISMDAPKGHVFAETSRGFKKLLRLKSGGAYDRFDELLEDVARVNGLASLAEMFDLANPKWKVPMMKAPVLLVHSTDDPVVPVRHARRMDRYAANQPNIQTLVTSWGGHTQFELQDPVWYWEVIRRFLGAVVGEELESLAGK